MADIVYAAKIPAYARREAAGGTGPVLATPRQRQMAALQAGMMAGRPGQRTRQAHEKLNGPVVQRAVKPVDEQRLIALEQANEGDIDPSYFDGLYEGAQGEFLVYAGVQARSVFKRALDKNAEVNEADAGASVHLYTPVENTTEDKLADLLNAPDDMSLIAEDERKTTLGAIKAAATALVSAQHADGLPDQIISRALSGEPKQGGGGEFGALSFRFKSAKDYRIWTDDEKQAEHFNELGYTNVAKTDTNFFESMRDAYSAEFPFAAQRRHDRFLYVETEADQRRLLGLALQSRFSGGVDILPARSTAFDAGLHKANVDNPPIDAPGANKDRKKEYKRTAVRGSRGTGQKAAMNNVSARDYVAHFIGAKADAVKWEWLHLQGSRLGGQNDKANLVAGTESANTAMIPWEREVLALTRLATQNKPVNVDWSATLQTAGGQRTHVGDVITMTVAMPSGLGDSNVAKTFTQTFKATEGAPYTSLDGEHAKTAAKAQSGRN